MYLTQRLLNAISARDLQARSAAKWARRAAVETNPDRAAEWAEYAADSRRMLKWWNNVIADMTSVSCKPSKAERKAMRLAAANLGKDSSNQLLRGTADGEQIAALPMEQFEANAYRCECLEPTAARVELLGRLEARKSTLKAFATFRRKYIADYGQPSHKVLAKHLPA